MVVCVDEVACGLNDQKVEVFSDPGRRIPDVYVDADLGGFVIIDIL